MTAGLWLFLPTYNEAENLEEIVRATVPHLELAAPGDWRLLVVDDDSPDGTGALADRLAGEIEGVEVLHRPGKQGLGPAYLDGFERALGGGAERVIVMDADFSHDPSYLPAMIAASREADLVLGSRYVRGGQILDWPPVRRLLSRCGSIYARAILGVRVDDLTSGFRCVHRRVLEAVEPPTLRSQGYVFNIELTYRALLAGFSVREIPIRFRDREAGDSKMSLPIAFEALILVPRLRGLRRDVVEHATNGNIRATRRLIRWRPPHWPGRREGVLTLPGADPAGNRGEHGTQTPREPSLASPQRVEDRSVP